MYEQKQKFQVFSQQKKYIFLADKGPPPLLSDISAKNVSCFWDGFP